MPPSIRLLPLAVADGPTNMAADEALLESAAGLGVASLRFYAWSEPTLSLGYFQPATARSEVPNLNRLAWVRRSTGGAAIVHHDELTYAIALPPGVTWQPKGESWICRFHHVLQAVLADHGIRSRAVVCGEEKQLGEVLCFLHQTAGDVLIDGSKVAGSAQRKMRGALLQHGSILLGRSALAPQLPGIRELSGKTDLTREALAHGLCRQFAANTGWVIEEDDWTAAESARIPEIRAQKYANPEWNAKR
ncbi:MAG TPA: biotin/lipoate A/B protein ligase family protein [Gemmataceae bacterium]|nr:biotin/lipoate A/B protein ligase family protein [Gemmataceae bacterium]